MKYIKTKDSIRATDNLVVPCPQELIDHLKEEDFIDDIIKEADTIEELCDGFIGVPDKEWFEKNRVATKGVNYFQKPFDLEYYYCKKDFANLKLKNQNGWEYTAIEWQKDRHNFIFGYIETDKGLIYVAKMNEEGELELL